MVLLGSKQVITTDDSTTLDWAQNLLQKDHHDHGAKEEYYFPKAPSTGTSTNTTTGRDHNQGPTVNITINSSSTDHERCPRCDSRNTKFCYYNNYNRSQPRHLCKTCRRHWTKGGTLRNVPIGGARTRGRKKNNSTTTTTSTTSNLKKQQQQHRRRLIKPTTTTTTSTSSHCSYLPLIFSHDQDHQMKTQLQYCNNLEIETTSSTTTTGAAHENFLVINNNDVPPPPPPSLPHPTTTMPNNFFPPLDEYPPVSINDDIVTSYNYQLIDDVDDDHRSFLLTSDLQYYHCSDDSNNFIEYFMTSTGHL